VVVPEDARIYAEQAFAFAEFNSEAVADLLNRTRPDGGGDSFYNIEAGAHPATRIWAKIGGGTLSGDSAGATPHFHSDDGGFDAGFDVAPDVNSRIGLAAGYGDDTLKDATGAHSNETVARVSLYGSENIGPFGLSAAVSYAHAWDRTDRATGVGGASASFEADDVTGAVQLSRPFDLMGIKATPDVGVQVSNLHTDAFRESFAAAPAFAVDGASASSTFTQPYAEFGLSKAYMLANGMEVTPDALIGYRYDGAARGVGVALTAADGTVFTGRTLGYDRNEAMVRFGINLHRGGWTGFVRYRADLASDWNNQTGQIGFRYAF
jgi:uncharacterized protein with beta-barrel porin domain